MKGSIKAARAETAQYHCDHCDAGFEYSYENLFTTERETAVGSFKFSLCKKCCVAMRRMSKVRRHKATIAAIIRHAARYSLKFAEFVADWYGVNMPRHLPGGAA